MRRIFLDTIGLLALWNTRDQWHQPATSALSELAAAELWTSTLILLECGNAAARTPMRGAVVDLRRHLVDDGKLIEPSDDDHATAWAAYAKGEAGDAGIVDQVSFAVMRRVGLTEAFTNDRHFKAAGFHTLF